MSGADLRVFYRLNGQRVAETPNALWYRPSPVAWSVFPYRSYPETDDSDYSALWRSSPPAFVARAVRAPREREITKRALYLTTAPYDIGALSSNTRSKVRRGLDLNEIRRSEADSLRTYPNNALVFSITSSVLATTDVHDVSYGLESVERGREQLNAFKISMGFERVPVHETVRLRPGVRTLRGPLVALAACGERVFPDRDGFRKAVGLLASDCQNQCLVETGPRKIEQRDDS